MKRIVLGLLGILILGLALGCTGGRKVTSLTKSDNGTSITIHKGDSIKVSLEGNPTTGYTWEWLSADASFLKLSGEPEFRSDSKLIGAGGVSTFTFDVDDTGSGTLHLIYHRTFEPGVPPLEDYSVSISAE